MAKATVHQTPSQALINGANDSHAVTDGKGRVIALKKPGVLAQFQLVEALGEVSKNQVYMAMVMPLIFVASIDGDAICLPRTKLQVEALIQRLEEDGVMVVQQAVQDHFGRPDPEADKAALKN